MIFEWRGAMNFGPVQLRIDLNTLQIWPMDVMLIKHNGFV